MKDKREALEYAKKWLKIIKQEELPDKDLWEWIISESTSNFKEHFNRWWLENRKSITQAWEWAVTEWNWKWAMFRDVMWRKYIDFLGWYGLMSHGWSNPDIIEAVNAQLLRSPMPSQELIDPLRWAFARIMSEITPGKIKYSFFAASWTEAVEWAIKLAKLYTKKDAFIVATDAFHGKTMWSLSMIWKSNYREPLGQLYGWHVYHIPFWNADALEQQLETCRKIWVWVAWVMFEPIQWEAWAIVPPDDFWPRARELTKRYETLLIADEVQTWLWRTGKFWWVDNWDVAPDIMTSWKALWGWVMPVSAFSAKEEIWQSLMYPNPFMHTTTTGWWALACAAAIASISVALRDDYPSLAEEKWNYIKKKLEKLASKYPQIYTKITWKWLLLWQHFVSNDIWYKVSAECFKRWLLVAWTLNSSKTIRVEPPIVISYEEIDEWLNRLSDALKTVAKMCDNWSKKCKIN